MVINTAYPAYADDFVAWAADGWVAKSADLAPLITEIENALSRAASAN